MACDCSPEDVLFSVIARNLHVDVLSLTYICFGFRIVLTRETNIMRGSKIRYQNFQDSVFNRINAGAPKLGLSSYRTYFYCYSIEYISVA